MSEEARCDERQEERKTSDHDGLAEAVVQQGRINLRAREERQEDAAERGEEVDPGSGHEAEQVAGDHAQRDLAEAISRSRGGSGEPHPLLRGLGLALLLAGLPPGLPDPAPSAAWAVLVDPAPLPRAGERA